MGTLERTLRACGRGSSVRAMETHVRLVRDVLGDPQRAERIAGRYGLEGA